MSKFATLLGESLELALATVHGYGCSTIWLQAFY